MRRREASINDLRITDAERRIFGSRPAEEHGQEFPLRREPGGDGARCNTRDVIDRLRAAAEALGEGDPEPLASLFADDAEWRGVSHGHLWWKRTPS